MHLTRNKAERTQFPVYKELPSFQIFRLFTDERGGVGGRERGVCVCVREREKVTLGQAVCFSNALLTLVRALFVS